MTPNISTTNIELDHCSFIKPPYLTRNLFPRMNLNLFLLLVGAGDGGQGGQERRRDDDGGEERGGKVEVRK